MNNPQYFSAIFTTDVGIKVSEIGFHVAERDGRTFLVVSPDADGMKDGKRHVVFEIKCPTPKEYGHQQMYKVPPYYAVQVLSEMNVGP